MLLLPGQRGSLFHRQIFTSAIRISFVHRNRPSAANSGAEKIDVQEWDVVVIENDREGDGIFGKLARVSRAGDESHQVEILEQEDSVTFVATGEEIEIECSQVVAVVEYEYSQRQADRLLNPHGEHAEEMFFISETELSERLSPKGFKLIK